MSFLDSVKRASASVVKTVSDASKSAVKTVNEVVADLQAYPTQVMCSQCKQKIDVPAGLFHWECEQKHSNDRATIECKECKAPRPKELPIPKVHCGACNIDTDVPTSNAFKYVKEGGENLKIVAKQGYEQTKESVNYLKSAPSTFHCAHCDALLAVPTGPWACQTCTLQNTEEAHQCARCSQKKSDQKAICGVCGQSTKIPTSNFTNQIFHNIRSVSKTSKRILYDVSGAPYVTCPRCNANIKVHLKPKTVEMKEGVPAAASAAEAKGPVEEAGKGSAPAPAPVDASAASSASSVAAPHAVDHNINDEVVCDQCKHKFSANE